jgi:hypothetical protein
MEDIPMFVIHPDNAADWQHAMFIMSHYRDIYCELFSDAEEASSTYMVVDAIPPGFEPPTEEQNHNLRMVEMAFQMNWHQKGGHRCVHCDALLEPLQEETCGHLTFNKAVAPWRPAF